MKLAVIRDSKGQVMWISKRANLSPLTYREYRAGRGMAKGDTIKKSIFTFHAPFTKALEEENDRYIIQWREKLMKGSGD